MARLRSLARLALVAGLAAGCGHKGPPVAPPRRTPPMPGQFQLAQRGDALEVTCLTPRVSVDGVAYEAVDVEIFWGEGRVDLEKEGLERTVRAAPGARVVQSLPLPPPGTLVRAAARARAGGREGERTLILALEAQPPLTPPTELTGQLREEGVALSWEGPLPEPVAPPDLGFGGGAPLPFSRFLREGPPDAPPDTEGDESTASPPARGPGPGPGARPPEGGALVGEEGEPLEEAGPTHGFRIYRRARSEASATPLGRDPQESRQFLDKTAPVGRTACYAVRAVASVEPLIESAPSNEVCIDVRDITPPSPPTGLAVVPRDGGLDVVWSPSPARDIRGYRVYRATGGGEAKAVADVEGNATSWHDARAESGVLYRYTVTALDRAGNEGPPSGAAEGRPD